jgi:hypothetical protein
MLRKAYNSSLSKFLSIFASSSVSSWWTPFSISWLAFDSIARASSCASTVVREGILKPRSEGLADRRPFSTASVALKARMLMLFTMSSIRACGSCQRLRAVGGKRIEN